VDGLLKINIASLLQYKIFFTKYCSQPNVIFTTKNESGRVGVFSNYLFE